MSGGSYDYMGSRAGWCDFIHLPDTLTRMRDRLQELPYAAKAAADTQTVIDHLNAAIDQAAKLGPAWHAIEWWTSGDWGEDQAKLVVEHYATCPCDPGLRWDADGNGWLLTCQGEEKS
ncbi:hypothetical protein [Nonomuraea sp. NPDC001023]|uniref:hypothetical protein n=1 Tax=unclassified Nonomuraea TaxID=2593643 RepID=UPI003328A6FD